jgi:hypothetical protein
MDRFKRFRGLSPLANCTDRETAACQRSLCQLLGIEGCRVINSSNPLDSNLGFFRPRAATFTSKFLPNCTHEAEWTAFQTHYFSENLIAPGVELGPLDL